MSTTTAESRYTFDNATAAAAQQVRLLTEILDDHTTEQLDRLLPEREWRCLDLGAGSGSIARWLASDLGTVVHVVAVDSDPRHIQPAPRLEIRTADVRTADLGVGEYDLIHARLLFMHLPERDDIVRRAVAALKPGGYLVTSDWVCTRLDEMVLRGPEGLNDAFLAFQTAMCDLAVSLGASVDWALRAPIAFEDAGLIHVDTATYNRVWSGGEAGCLLHACNSHQLEEPLLARGGVTAQQLAIVRAAMSDPATRAWSYPMVTTIGRRADA